MVIYIINKRYIYIKSSVEDQEQSLCVPIAFSIPIIVASQILPAGSLVHQDFQRLVDASKQVICIIRTHPNKCGNVLLHLCWRQPPREVQHGIYKIGHVEGHLEVDRKNKARIDALNARNEPPEKLGGMREAAYLETGVG